MQPWVWFVIVISMAVVSIGAVVVMVSTTNARDIRDSEKESDEAKKKADRLKQIVDNATTNVNGNPLSLDKKELENRPNLSIPKRIYVLSEAQYPIEQTPAYPAVTGGA